ncbi:MAG: Male germ-cell putative homeodomain transcription factor [Marteilia pararefringens]
MNSPSIINIILMICESIQRAIYSSIILMFLFLTGVELKKGEMIAYLFNCMTSPYMTSKLGMFYLSLDTQDNIKLWIIVKSMLKQRSYRQLIDGCISTSITLIFVFVLVIGQKLLEFEKEKSLISFFLFDSDKITCEILCWTLIIGAFVLQYSTDLNEIYRKHQVSRSILLTETINIHTSPSKNTNTNERKNVLDLLKNVRSLTGQMESPYRITSLSANPIICNAVRFIVIAVVSALISDLIGTKITLTKIFK